MDEEGNRWRKVAKLVGVLYSSKLHIDPKNLSVEQWAIAASIAQVDHPSEKTKRLVIKVCIPWI